jgi:phosphoribosylamine--glycine ligase
MRFLGLGEDGSLSDMYLRLLADGHEVRVFAASAENLPLKNRISYVADWHSELAWIKAADGIVIFENSKMGAIQDQLRNDGINVIGGSVFGDRLEGDREFGQQTNLVLP